MTYFTSKLKVHFHPSRSQSIVSYLQIIHKGSVAGASSERKTIRVKTANKDEISMINLHIRTDFGAKL